MQFFRMLFRYWSSPSQDGKGRTLFQRIFGLNVKDTTSQELKYFNPLQMKIKATMSIDDLEYRGISFLVEAIETYETTANGKKFVHTDYLLKGISMSEKDPVRVRVRCTPNKDAVAGYQVEVYRHYDEFKWDEGFYENVLKAENHEFHVEQDDNGNQLEVPSIYWRVNGAEDPYCAVKTTMTDGNKDGQIEESEIEKTNVSFWDYSRETDNPETKQPFLEYILVEMDDNTKYFTIYRGRQIEGVQLSVI